MPKFCKSCHKNENIPSDAMLIQINSLLSYCHFMVFLFTKSIPLLVMSAAIENVLFIKPIYFGKI